MSTIKCPYVQKAIFNNEIFEYSGHFRDKLY